MGVDLLELLPDVFTLAKEGQERLLTITEGAQAFADGIVDEVISRNPVWLPRPEAPQQWTAWDQGGTNDNRLQLSLTSVRSNTGRRWRRLFEVQSAMAA